MQERPHKILLVTYFNYHLYDYIEPLIEALIKHGFDVTLLTCDDHLVDKYQNVEGLKISRITWVKAIMNRMGCKFARPFGWCIGWVWGLLKTMPYDLVIAPTDNKPFYHMITSWKKSLICQGGVGNHDKKFLQHKYKKDIERPNPNHYVSGGHGLVDKIFGGSFVKNVRGPSAKKFYTVTGPDIADFYECLGVPKGHISVVGNPNYETANPYKKSMSKISKKLNLQDDERLYIFFSSQIHFEGEDLRMLSKYVDKILNYDASAKFCFKVHPRLSGQELKKLEKWQQQYPKDKTIILNGYGGDHNNAQLIAVSHLVIIEDSNVGLLAVHQDKPVIIIDLKSKKYTSESFFTYYEGILNCENHVDFDGVLKRLFTSRKWRESQKSMCDHVCIKNKSPCGSIAELCNKIITSS